MNFKFRASWNVSRNVFTVTKWLTFFSLCTVLTPKSDVELKQLVKCCYREFPEDPVPVKKIFDGTWVLTDSPHNFQYYQVTWLTRNRSYAVELFHGPTFCFKDLGQQVLCRFIAHFVKRPTTLIGMITPLRRIILWENITSFFECNDFQAP